MSSRPTLPPRRQVNNDDETASIPHGIAARIANLHLDELVHNPFSRHSPVPQNRKEEVTETYYETTTHAEDDVEVSNGRPPIPPRETRPTPTQGAAKPPNIARALKRVPPPPPGLRSDSTKPPVLPARRVPPVPTGLSTPPPDSEGEACEHEEHGHNERMDDSCLKCRDFSQVDAHAAKFPRRKVKSLDKLSHDLTSPFPSETEKARAIFTWLHHNVAYDAQSYFSGDIKPATAEATLSSGLAVCEGYAGLFKYLAERAGLEVMMVSGHGKGYGYVSLGPGHPVPEIESNHAWNCVQMDGEWHLIDCCWGAGVLEGMSYNPIFAPMWFSSTPSEFGRRHFPLDPGYQLIADEDGGPVSWEDYILAPEGPLIFQDFYKLDLALELLQPATKQIEGGRQVTFHIWKRCEHISTADADNYVLFVATNDDKRTPMEPNSEGGWSATVYIPHGGEVFVYYVSEVDGRDGKGLGVEGFKKASGRKAMSFGGCCRWTVL